jgi:ankyrin repeat protein
MSELYRKWGIQHFLMKFPSLKLIKFFKSKIRDFNSQNNQLMSPLHLFCKYIKRGNLLETTITLPPDYRSENILEFLLQNGLNPNCFDSSKALPLLYAALNGQFEFIVILRKFKS